MKIGIVSDLHLEMHRDGGGSLVADLMPDGCDVLVVAGDLSSGERISDALRTLCERFAHVVFVCGNHELYGSSPGRVQGLMAAAEARHANLHWLRPSHPAEVDGQRFVGGTMWFPRTSTPRAVNDFRAITSFEPWVYEENEATVRYLSHVVVEDDVVVTHHLPSYRSVARQYVGSPANAFFVCDVEEVMLARRPKLWIHGHTHAPCDYVFDHTRVVCNPFGYPAEGVPCDLGKVIEV